MLDAANEMLDAAAQTPDAAAQTPDAAADSAAALRSALSAARLYLVCDAKPGGRRLEEVLPAAIAGGVDIVQLREKQLKGEALLDAAKRAARLCEQAGALFVVNDDPDIAVLSGANGVHVGQEDMRVAEVRAIVGHEMLIGLSTHAESEIDATSGSGADYIGVGPVYETPTKLGRPAVGTRLVTYAAAHATLPFFAIGGIDESNMSEVVAAGARNVCVLRAIANADDPEAAAAKLKRSLR